MIANLTVILFLAVLGIWKSIPVGFILNLHPILVCTMTILGASLGVLVIYMLGSRLKQRILQSIQGKANNKKQKKIHKIFNRYGVPGLGMLATLIVGPALTMVLGLTIVKNGKDLLLWTNIGIVVWSVLLTLIGQVGVNIL
jgi:membrane protein DedA with SNARE-associated domain